MIWRNLTLSFGYPEWESRGVSAVFARRTHETTSTAGIIEKIENRNIKKTKRHFVCTRLFRFWYQHSQNIKHATVFFPPIFKSQHERVQICGLWLFQSCKSMIIYNRRPEQKIYLSMSALIFIKNQFRAYFMLAFLTTADDEREERGEEDKGVVNT